MLVGRRGLSRGTMRAPPPTLSARTSPVAISKASTRVTQRIQLIAGGIIADERAGCPPALTNVSRSSGIRSLSGSCHSPPFRKSASIPPEAPLIFSPVVQGIASGGFEVGVN
jgi:hypothetical protein